jgi:hypothetical protein
MSSLFRLVDPQGELVTDGASVEHLKRILEDLPPSRYHFDEIAATPLRSGHTARRWGSC